MDRVAREGEGSARVYAVVGGLTMAMTSLCVLCASLLPGSTITGSWSDRLCAIGTIGLIGGTQFAAGYALPNQPMPRWRFGHGDPGTRTEYALRSTEPYFKRALAVAFSVSVATGFGVRWAQLHFGCSPAAYWFAVVPFAAAIATSIGRVYRRARSY